MGGGLLQLVAYGAQDVYLTGNPQITFFKVAYRRHTNFALEAIEQTFNGSTSLGSRVTCQITRNGDLINRVYFVGTIQNTHSTNSSTGNAALNNPIALVPYFGLKLLKTIELEIGGQRIDKHYSEWLYIWNELSLPIGKRDGFRLMVGGDRYNRSIILDAQQTYSVYVPLEFWFCRNVGLALPLIALQYHEVKINIEFESGANMVDTNKNYSDRATTLIDSATSPTLITGIKMNSELTTTTTAATKVSLTNASLWVDYIFLDTDERRRFAQLSHEYLIEQLQFTGTDTVSGSTSTTSLKSIRMNFNHPCKELIWVIKPNQSSGANSIPPYWNNFTTRDADNNYIIGKNPVTLAKIQLNGNDRFTERIGSYFNLVQPYQHHENTPNIFNNGINVYSFAIKPEEHQPSGTLNMSRIDTAVLSLASSVSGTIYIFTVNYNVLRILSGMGGLAYSN
uniref:Major capsid protein N-terminal domain-containing protein n=1 Tax=viral metagenome TaxID=1070528 RepID=A0A6C0DPV8_9ZZZZ